MFVLEGEKFDDIRNFVLEDTFNEELRNFVLEDTFNEEKLRSTRTRSTTSTRRSFSRQLFKHTSSCSCSPSSAPGAAPPGPLKIFRNRTPIIRTTTSKGKNVPHNRQHRPHLLPTCAGLCSLSKFRTIDCPHLPAPASAPSSAQSTAPTAPASSPPIAGRRESANPSPPTAGRRE